MVIKKKKWSFKEYFFLENKFTEAFELAPKL